MAAEQKQLRLWFQQRSVTRVNANRELGVLSSLQTAQDDHRAIELSRDKLEHYRERLREFDEKLLPALEDEDKLRSAVAESDAIDVQLTEAILAADRDLKRAQVAAQATFAAQPSSNQGASPNAPVQTAKLPQLDLVKFDGDTLQWQTFWDSFNAVVHSKVHLSKIEKFQYLKTVLTGEAARIVDGYPLTDAAYQTVLDALKERYDNPEQCIFAHLNAMIAMKPASGDVAEIQCVFDECESHIRSLVVLGMAEDTFGRVFTPLILSKVPRFVRIELYRRNGNQTWTLSNLRKYLKDEIVARQHGAQSLSTCSEPQRASNRGRRNSYGQRSAPSAGSSLVAMGNESSRSGPQPQPPKFPCQLCEEKGHFPTECTRYTTLQERLNAIKDNCRVCLKRGHAANSCRKFRTRCRLCGAERQHHQCLCPTLFPKRQQSHNSSSLNATVEQYVPATAAVAGQVGQKRAVMPTALASIKGLKGRRTARVIFDTASTQSFARSDVLKAVGAKKLGTDYLGLAGVQAETRKVEPFGCYELIVTQEDGTEVAIIVHALKAISCPIDRPVINPADYPVLKKLILADPISPGVAEMQLDVMLGLDYYYEFVTAEQIRLSKGLILMGTTLGYVAAGCVQDEGSKRTETALIVASVPSDRQLDDDLQRLWCLEDVGCREEVPVSEDKIAKRNFLESVQYDTELQRYSVRWPWKIEKPNLPTNFGLACGRLTALLKRLDEQSLRQYDDILQTQKANGIIEKAPREPTGPLVHYIPHHAVIRADKATTKVRVVYDASCKSSKADLSLNECIYRGPVLLADLCGLLMRFRTHPIGLISDIEKAFLQVGLQPVDRDVTRFLWLKDTSRPLTKENLAIYRFARVLFGVIASPYMLGGTIEIHMRRIGTPIAEQIARDNYVDNVISGEDSTEDAKTFYQQAKENFLSASMNLREWFSNCAETMASIPANDRGVGTTTTVLGLLWDTQSDTLACKAKLSDCPPSTTKRGVLKTVASLFDPLGFLAPVTVKARTLLQELWKRELTWDAPIPDDLQQRWVKLYPDLQLCLTVEVPRRCLPLKGSSMELHCFSDASLASYGSAVYLRAENGGSWIANLVFAKARVCPLKQQNLKIPRLELTALALGCRLLKLVEAELHLGPLKLYAWTDSMCSYHWVNEDSDAKIEERPVYVKNRIREILAKKPFELRYIPTAMNPADFLTKGMSVSELNESKRWWHGPEFLSDREETWPLKTQPITAGTNKHVPAPGESEAAGKKLDAISGVLEVTLTASTTCCEEFLMDPSGFSTLNRLLRVTAWILRFVHNARNVTARADSVLSAAELSHAFAYWLRATQREYVATNPEDFAKSKRNLKLFEDPSGIQRCQGRIEHADLEYEVKYPALVPRRSRLVELLVADTHERLAHAGVSQTLAEIRQHWWIPRGRAEVARITRSCVICRKYKGGPYKMPSPPPLPEFRLETGAAFASIGIDYLGPLATRQPATRDVFKCWICLFTCCSTRAVHLEVTTDMTQEQFLLAFRRFAALYGCPKLVVCDNAKQFKAGEKAIAKIWKDVLAAEGVQSFWAKNQVMWKYIVEKAPWMGGLYERMVGIVKKALRCSIQRQLLSLIELQTVCAEVCAIVNARPLTYVEEELGVRPLRPCDLITRNRSGFPAVDFGDSRDPDYEPRKTRHLDAVSTWKRLENRLKEFWRTWSHDYLLALRERHWNHGNRGGSSVFPKVGSVVLVRKELMPRSIWLMGRISDITRSADGEIRSARVKLSDGSVIHRPLKDQFPLETGPDDNENGLAKQSSARQWGIDSSASESED